MHTFADGTSLGKVMTERLSVRRGGGKRNYRLKDKGGEGAWSSGWCAVVYEGVRKREWDADREGEGGEKYKQKMKWQSTKGKINYSSGMHFISGDEEGEKQRSWSDSIWGSAKRRKKRKCITVPVNGSKEVLSGSSPRRSRGHHVLLGDPVGWRGWRRISRTGVEHLTWDRETFNPHSYRRVNTLQVYSVQHTHHTLMNPPTPRINLAAYKIWSGTEEVPTVLHSLSVSRFPLLSVLLL